MKYLVIGAGPCGLAVARALKKNNIEYEHVEAENQLGGNWSHGVYETVYTDACKEVMQFTEFPMPESYPDFLSKSHMLEYLNNYANHFNLISDIKFNTKVIWVASVENNKWKVTFQDKSFKLYNGIIICNGHHWDMNFANLNGNYSGEIIHSKEYRKADQLANKRVLVIGSGNSAADIACEAARIASSSYMSLRDSPWIFPKSFMGIPLGRNKLKFAPKIIQPLLIKILLKLSFGKHSYYNLPKPRHKVFEKHPTVSEELPYYLKHGRIKIKPPLIKTENKTVWFEDNSSMEFDLIVSATGFNLSFPFLPSELIKRNGKNLKCIGYSLYPDYKGLFFMGWPQVRGGIVDLASVFSNVIVDLIKLEETCNIPAGMVLLSMGDKQSKTHLYGAMDIYKWVKKHPLKKLLKYGRKISKNVHLNSVSTENESI